MRVLVVTQYYPPEGLHIPPTVAHALAQAGHDVRVITGFPNYPEGRIYPGFKQRWRSFALDGKVQLLRVPLYADHSENSVRRIANYVSFALSVCSARRYAKGFDVIYVYATQMTPALGPWLWHLLGGSPYVLHIQDLWPDSITGSTLMEGSVKSKLVHAFLTPWLRSLYKHAAAVIGIAPTMVSTLIERGVDREKAHTLFNWSEKGQDAVFNTKSQETVKGVNLLYAGNVGDMQDLETVVKAAALSRDEGVRVTILGDGVALPRIRQLADELGATNVKFRGRVSRSEVGSSYENADFALVTLKDLPAFRGTIPSKFQAALAHGVPVITTVQGDLRAFVEEHEVGYTAEVENPEDLSLAFCRALNDGPAERQRLADNAKKSYEKNFSPTAGTKAVENILNDAVNSSARRRDRGYDG